MNNAGEVSPRPPGRPVILVVLRHDPNHHTNLRAPQGIEPVYALLDTGADSCYAPPDVISAIGWPYVASALTHGATAGETQGGLHLGHVFFPEAAVQIETGVYSASLRNSPATQHFLIGMDVIQHGVLIMDFKKDIYRLYLG
jgi:predicted aspartyl protease